MKWHSRLRLPLPSIVLGVFFSGIFASVPQGLAQANCSPAYPTVCIPPPPPDLDCKDVPHKNFQVKAPDPHRFDRDKDGIGCETRSTNSPKKS